MKSHDQTCVVNFEVSPARSLRTGDIISMEPYRPYYLKILSGPEIKKDKFGRSMMQFQVEIISGPDRVGETGPITFGSRGVIKKKRTITKTFAGVERALRLTGDRS